MTTIIFSAYGTVVLDSEFAVYSINESICNSKGEKVDTDSESAQHFVSDLIIETNSKRYSFPKAKYGYEFAARIGQYLVDTKGKDLIITIDLHKLNEHIDFELLCGSSMKIEYI